MDHGRFDRLAKRFAGASSRRGLLAAAAASFSALGIGSRATSAAPYSVPLGGACYRDRQCVPSTPRDSPDDLVYCAYNAQSYDGGYNCCRFDNGRCQFDGDCCGYLICADGYCYDIYGPPYG